MIIFTSSCVSRVWQSVYLYIYLQVYPFVCVHLSVCVSVCLSVCPFVSVCVSVCLCLALCLADWLSVCLSVCLQFISILLISKSMFFIISLEYLTSQQTTEQFLIQSLFSSTAKYRLKSKKTNDMIKTKNHWMIWYLIATCYNMHLLCYSIVYFVLYGILSAK